LIDVHGCRIIDFMTGIPEHPHSLRREKGYRSALEKHGIEFDRRRVHDGDFWYNKGDDVADEILNSDLPKPQAVVCASDTMAISLCDAFKKRGIRVPDDIAVTGYDFTNEGKIHTPSVSSAECRQDRQVLMP
jgi:DNA-binding LacI/PurR family transcriptional regulator